MPKLERAVYKVLFECLKLKPGDSFLILVDQATRDLGQLFFKRANRSLKEVVLLEIKPPTFHSSEPAPTVVNMMRQMSTVLLFTSYALIHSDALKQICHNGARVICLNPLQEEALARSINADFAFINKKSRRLADLFSIGRQVQLVTPAGTDLTIPISQQKASANTGVVSRPGTFCILPAGEASITPESNGTKGVLVIDGSIPSIGVLKKPIVINVKDGYAYQITGDEQAIQLRKILKPFGRQSRIIAEFGIGTNPKAILTGDSIEDEKVLGTAHIALGDSQFEGGSLQKNLHLDLIIRKPTITIDGRPIVINGKLMV